MTDTQDSETVRKDETAGRPAAPPTVRTALTALSLFVLALIPRLSAVWLGFITPDEPFWVYSSIRFLRALTARRWADTLQIGHPGVITMWLGTLGIWWQRWRDVAAADAHLAWVDHVSWIAPENAALYPHLIPFLAPARVAVAVLTSLGLVGIYLLARRLWDNHVALLAGVLLALDPFAAGLSGLLHVDALAMTFVTLSLLAWLLALQRNRPLPALLSGICAGCAVLSQSSTILIAVLAGVSALLWIVRTPHRAGRGMVLALLWLVGAAAAVGALFPGMWANPPGMIRHIYGLAGRYTTQAPETTFFLGQSGGDPGPWFYPVVLGLRLTPVTLFGLVLSLPAMLIRPAGDPEKRIPAGLHLWLWAFVVGYTALMSLGAQKFDRYLLPTWPALTLLAASGWVTAIHWIHARLPHRGRRPSPAPDQPSAHVFAVILVVLAAGQGLAVLSGWPYYLDAYNPLAGGLRTALHTLPVGWGEGQEQMAHYMNQQRHAADLIVAGGGPVTLGPLFKGQVLSLSDRSRRLADMVLITALDRQIAPEQVADLLAGTRLVRTVRFGGTEALWLYAVEDRAEEEHLARYAAPSDLILVDAITPFVRRGQAENVERLDGAGEVEIVERLNEWSRSHTRLWYISYPTASPLTAPILRRQLDTYAVRLDHVDLGYATATLYILPSEPVFAAPNAFQTMNLGGQIALAGSAQLGEPPRAGEVLSLRLRWLALTSPRADYQAFIYLFDKQGHPRTAGQGGELLVDGRFWPTSTWQPGEGIEKDYALALPPALPPGQYQLAVGLFDATAGNWLPVLNEAGQGQGTAAAALTVDVAASETPPAPEVLSLGHPLRANWANRVRLLGYSHPANAHAGETLIVELGWQGIETAGQDSRVRLHLVDETGLPLHEQDLPLSVYPTSLWRPEEVIHELYDFTLPVELPAGTHTLTVQVLDATGEPLGPDVPLGPIEVLVTVSGP